ncbi:MAG TPA: alkene reductase [Xanthobacteraceae bacterium]|nr:alkene reductase [Xanthobacteraceae bacterium]
MAQTIDVFSPFRLGPLALPNRIVMAPMTRNRAGPGNVPTVLNATYYGQRAGAGLIVAEASQVSPQGLGYPGTPGIHSTEQIAGWRLVTDAVHAAGGQIFLQLWHVGRISHPSLQPDGALPLAPSAIAPAGQAWTLDGMKPYVTPRALETDEIPGIVAQYRQGAANAKAAGFDGVEVHAAHGYLLDQFLRDKTNRRADKYGGSAENRARLVVEVMEAVAGEWGGDRTGVHLSPTNLAFNDISDSDPAQTFSTAVRALDRVGLAYLHLVEPGPADPIGAGPRLDAAFFRPLWRSALVVNKAYDLDRANAVLRSGAADLVSFATLFIANPDLPERFRRGAPFNPPERKTYYGGSAKGYTDYPALGAQ